MFGIKKGQACLLKTSPTVKYRGGSIMIWKYLTQEGIVYFIIYTESLPRIYLNSIWVSQRPPLQNIDGNVWLVRIVWPSIYSQGLKICQNDATEYRLQRCLLNARHAHSDAFFLIKLGKYQRLCENRFTYRFLKVVCLFWDPEAVFKSQYLNQ